MGLFGGEKKKLEATIDACLVALKEKNFTAARKLIDAALVLLPEVKGEPALHLSAHGIAVVVALAQSDWAAAESYQRRALDAVTALFGPSSKEVVAARQKLVELLTDREKYDEAVALAQQTMGLLPTETVEQFSTQMLRTDALLRAARYPEAIAAARATFEAVRKRFGDNTVASLKCARQLATCLAESGGDAELDQALALAAASSRTLPPGHELGPENHLCCAAIVGTVLLKRGAGNELVTFCDRTKAEFAGSRGAVTPALRDASAQLGRLRAEGLALIGQIDAALGDYRTNVRGLELEAGLKHPRLISALEGLGRMFRLKGDPLEGDNVERRAAAIRFQVTGKKTAPAQRQQPAPAPRPPQLWPRRTLAGIFYFRGVNERMVHSLMQTVAPRLQDPAIGGLKVLMPRDGNEAVVLARNCGRAFDPPVAVAVRRMLEELGQAVNLVNTAVGAQGQPVQLVPWWSVIAGIEVAWWNWPEGERQRFERDVFPALPDWGGNFEQPSWFGDGVQFPPGGEPSVSPSIALQFVAKVGIALTGIGPGGLFDAWFSALSAKSGLFPMEMYARFNAPAPTMPAARA